MGIFGCSLPPGCGTLPGEELDPPCEICGNSVDYCICPTCPVCESCGDPLCYEQHGLVRAQEQIDSLTEHERAWESEAKANSDDLYQLFQDDLVTDGAALPVWHGTDEAQQTESGD